MIDFSKCEQRNKAYGGVNGRKISVVYDGELYMLKFSSRAQHNPNMSYSNSCITEYISCHVFNDIGIEAQETLLGTWPVRGIPTVVVACKDFTVPGVVLQDFASIKNQIVDSERNGYGTELADIEETIREQKFMDPEDLSNHFWDVFVVDALIGNWDRHNGNWGFLYNQATDTMSLAPIYDCGSSLFPQLDEEEMRGILVSEQEQRARVYERPSSAIELNGKRINYQRFFRNEESENCQRALARIYPRISMDRIYSIIENTPGITPVQAEFYKTMISRRHEIILSQAYHILPAQIKEEVNAEYYTYSPKVTGLKL